MRQRCIPAGFKVPFERMSPKQYGKLHLRHGIKQWPPPMVRTFGARCCIAASSGSGKTETHGDNGYFRCVVENIFGHAHPRSQPITAGIIERSALGMRDSPRSLADNQDPRGTRRLHDRLWPKGQVIAKYTFANLLDQLVDEISRDDLPYDARF